MFFFFHPNFSTFEISTAWFSFQKRSVFGSKSISTLRIFVAERRKHFPVVHICGKSACHHVTALSLCRYQFTWLLSVLIFIVVISFTSSCLFNLTVFVREFYFCFFHQWYVVCFLLIAESLYMLCFQWYYSYFLLMGSTDTQHILHSLFRFIASRTEIHIYFRCCSNCSSWCCLVWLL